MPSEDPVALIRAEIVPGADVGALVTLICAEIVPGADVGALVTLHATRSA